MPCAKPRTAVAGGDRAIADAGTAAEGMGAGGEARRAIVGDEMGTGAAADLSAQLNELYKLCMHPSPGPS